MRYIVKKKFLGGPDLGEELDIDITSGSRIGGIPIPLFIQSFVDSGYIEESNGKWKPEWGHEYWIVDTFGDVAGSTYNSSVDESRFDLGNCFRTKEEAEHARDIIREALKGI